MDEHIKNTHTTDRAWKDNSTRHHIGDFTVIIIIMYREDGDIIIVN